MFQAIKNLFTPTHFSVGRNRGLFVYSNGTKTVKRDPLVIMARLDDDEEYRADVHPIQALSLIHI